MTIAICAGLGLIALVVTVALFWRWIVGLAELIPDHDNP